MVNLTITGIDRWTDLDRLAVTADEHPAVRIEWAVLYGSRNGQEPRFPGGEVVDRLLRTASETNIHCAIHLCGRYARAVNSGDYAKISDELVATCCRFDRIQVNLPGYDYAAMARFSTEWTGRPVIVQHRDGFAGKPPRPELHYLHDRSGGRGVEETAHWPKPWPDVRCGYAGGVGPRNIELAVQLVRTLHATRTPGLSETEASVAAYAGLGSGGSWIDMESGVRTNDRLDLDKVRFVAGRAAGTGA